VDVAYNSRMSEPLAFLHNELMPQGQARLTLHDAGFVLGAAVTDLVRTFRHRLYRFADHLARFRESCRLAYLEAPLSDAEITARAEELVAHNARLLGPQQDLALVLFATPGPIGYYLGESGGAGDGPVTFGMHTFPLPFARYRRLFEAGAYLAVPSVRHVPASSIDRRIKQRSRLHWWLAENELKQSHTGAQALLLDEAHHVTETASSNFLIVKDGLIITPPSPSILPGVSLKALKELSAELDIRWEERQLTLDDCFAADEALLTCTSYCLAGVSRLHDRAIPWPGPLYARLLGLWSERVGVDIAAQIRDG
jgi:branched-chain amino acid aminotransferase